jgi:hypothetical protein
VDTPPLPPPFNQRRPQPDDDVVVLPTPESEPKTSRTYNDIVKHYSSGKNHHQQPQDHKLKSIIIDPAYREVPPRRAGLRVRFADSPSCSTTSGIDSSRNTLWRKIDYPQVGMKTDRIRTDITDIVFVFIFMSGFGFEYG